MLKRKLAAGFAFLSLFSLCACNFGGDNSVDGSSSPSVEKPEVPQSLKILAIGNSYINDTLEYVGNFARRMGIKDIKIGKMYIGGSTLDQHYENAMADSARYEYSIDDGTGWLIRANTKISYALDAEDWDYVCLQQQSAASGNPSTYGNLDGLVAYVKERVKKEVKFIWNMTWAYQQNYINTSFEEYDNSQTTMYQRITETVQNVILPNEDFYIISPIGTAIQNARTSVLGDTLTCDGTHLSLPMGRYIAGLTFFKAVTGLPIDDLSNALDVSGRMKQIAIESANNAVKTPFAVTQSEILSW